MEITYEPRALQLDPNRRDGGGRWRMGSGVEEKVEARQVGGSEAGEEEGSEAERTKEERKDGGYSGSTQTAVRVCSKRQEGGSTTSHRCRQTS